MQASYVRADRQVCVQVTSSGGGYLNLVFFFFLRRVLARHPYSGTAQPYPMDTFMVASL